MPVRGGRGCRESGISKVERSFVNTHSNAPASPPTKAGSDFLGRHEFLLRRLHSLSGLVPVGAYMVVHLLVNASVLNGAATYQDSVYKIHSLGRILPIVEWGFIFLPLLFHAVFGVVIVRGGLPNTRSYPYGANIRYTLQRATGMVALLFILFHVFQMHGWFHFDWWLRNVAEPWGGHQFRPYNATSTAAEAVQQSALVSLFYLVGILACVFHLANGLWTMGITWGVWVTPAAQRRASVLCAVLGVGLGLVSLGAWGGFAFLGKEGREAAEQVEDRMYEARVSEGLVDPEQGAHKRRGHEEHAGPTGSESSSASATESTGGESTGGESSTGAGADAEPGA